MELTEIKAIIDLMRENDLSVFEMEKDGFRLKLQKGTLEQPSLAAPIVVSTPATASPTGTGTSSTGGVAAEMVATPKKAADSEVLKDIVSPMVGTFYRGAAPDSPPFVDVGKSVNEDTVVGIIEAMKVMNEIKAETSGVIAEVLAENGKPVQFGQVLFRVR